MKQMNQRNYWSSLLVLACLGLAQVAADDEETVSMALNEVVELIEPFGQSCETKPERSHVEEMVLNKEQPSHESKCFRRCMLLQFEIMPESKQQYDEQKTLEMMNMMFPEKEDQSKGIISKCNQAVPGVTDECEIAHGIAMCMLREMKSASYKIPEIKE